MWTGGICRAEKSSGRRIAWKNAIILCVMRGKKLAVSMGKTAMGVVVVHVQCCWLEDGEDEVWDYGQYGRHGS